MFNIKKLFDPKAIITALESKTKSLALKELSHHLKKEGFINNDKKFLKALEKREAQFSTGIGSQIAIPHAQSKYVINNVVLIAKTNNEIDWDSADKKPINLIFMICLNNKDMQKQTEVLQDLSKLMMNQEKMNNIRKLKKSDAIYKYICSL